MSASPESVTQSTQTPSIAQTTTTNAPVERTVTQESDFDRLWNKGAFDSPDEAKARAEANKKPEKVAKQPEALQQQPETTEQAPAQEAEQAEAQADAQEKTYATLDDYLKDSNIDPEGFMDLPITVKVDGQVREVPLKDLQKSYQLEGTLQGRLVEQAEQRRVFEAEQAQVRAALKTQVENTQALFQLAQTQLLKDYQGIDWNTLKATDPGRAALLQTEFQTQMGQINTHLQQIAQTREAEARRAQEDYAKALPQQREKLLELNPTWRDPAKFEADRKVMLAYGKTRGLTDEQLSGITDPNLVLLLHDAARFHAQQVAKPAVLKQVRAAPQMVKPGARVSRDPKATALNQARENWARNPRDEDAQAAVFSQFV